MSADNLHRAYQRGFEMSRELHGRLDMKTAIEQSPAAALYLASGGDVRDIRGFKHTPEALLEGLSDEEEAAFRDGWLAGSGILNAGEKS